MKKVEQSVFNYEKKEKEGNKEKSCCAKNPICLKNVFKFNSKQTNTELTLRF